MRKENTIGFGCLIDGKPVAACVSLIKNSNAEVVSLFVLSEYRRQGIANALLSKLYWETFYTTNASYISASYSLLNKEDSEALTSLYRTCGYRFDLHPKEYQLLEFKVQELVSIHHISDTTALPISSIGKYYASIVAKKLNELEFTTTAAFPESTDFDLSLAIFKNQDLLAFVWVEKLTDTIYRLAAIYNSTDNAQTIKSLIGQLIQIAKEKLNPEDIVVSDVYDYVSAKLINSLTDGKAQPSHLFTDAILII
ncbi:hypothetical protein SDC9_148062 [bioreactor metagenome]|uniref:N-acetyltransferase domain-containing protein n=1 Tax=bioreactor metagenome TaxID=1076179 RepID=A0A645EJH4_9ZZZZ